MIISIWLYQCYCYHKHSKLYSHATCIYARVYKHIYAHPHAGPPRELEEPRENTSSDCFNRVFDCSIRVYRSFGAHKQCGAQGKMPLPLSVALPTWINTYKHNYVHNTHYILTCTGIYEQNRQTTLLYICSYSKTVCLGFISIIVVSRYIARA